MQAHCSPRRPARSGKEEIATAVSDVKAGACSLLQRQGWGGGSGCMRRTELRSLTLLPPSLKTRSRISLKLSTVQALLYGSPARSRGNNKMSIGSSPAETALLPGSVYTTATTSVNRRQPASTGITPEPTHQTRRPPPSSFWPSRRLRAACAAG